MNQDRIIAYFRVRHVGEMEEKLNTAVKNARDRAAIDSALGLLVTRHHFDQFSVALSQDVPFGTTVERDLVRRN